MGQTAMMGLTGASTVAQFAGQRQQAGAVLAQGAYTQRIADWNAHLADLQAQDAVTRGQTAAARAGTAGAQVIGAQRASYAAQGIDANSGSAADVAADTARSNAIDQTTIRNNAAREAWGYSVQATNTRMQAQQAEAAAQNTAASLREGSWGTLLTGAAQTYGTYKAGGKIKTANTRSSGGTQLPDSTNTNSRVYG